MRMFWKRYCCFWVLSFCLSECLPLSIWMLILWFWWWTILKFVIIVVWLWLCWFYDDIMTSEMLLLLVFEYWLCWLFSMMMISNLRCLLQCCFLLSFFSSLGFGWFCLWWTQFWGCCYYCSDNWFLGFGQAIVCLLEGFLMQAWMFYSLTGF